MQDGSSDSAAVSGRSVALFRHATGTPQVSLASFSSSNRIVKSDWRVNPTLDPGTLEIMSFSNVSTVSALQVEEKENGPQEAREHCLKLPLHTQKASEISFYLKAPCKFCILLLMQPHHINIRASVLTTCQLDSHPRGVFSLLYYCFSDVRARTRQARLPGHP